MEFTFGRARPEAYLAAIATPGGTGAIRHVFYNYAEEGSRILIPDWYWGAYAVIAGEFGRHVETFSLFTGENTFNLASFQEKVQELLQEQENLVIVLNSPAHNPTGFSLSLREWQAVLSFLREVARNKTKKITLLVDIAYMDYAGEAEEVRAFFRLFGGLPENIVVTVAFSMSKTFLAYGLRCGALIAISSNRRVVEEFLEVNSYSNRANWSNVTRLPQELLVEIVGNPDLLTRIREERDFYRQLLAGRANIFVREAKEEQLEMCPYFAGFFISLPVAEAKSAASRLQQERVFAVPMKKGLRLAICSIPARKIAGLAAKIKSVLS
jgi:aromatic-amino-acid transaminase